MRMNPLLVEVRTAATHPQLVKAFYRAALFLKHRVDEDGWIWSSNYLREHVRCATSLQFSNSLSPVILREVRRQHPELAPYIDIKPLKRRHLSVVGDTDAQQV